MMRWKMRFLGYLVVYIIIHNSKCRPLSSECVKGHFKLDGMASCHAWLTCDEFDNITYHKPIGKGAVKSVFLVKWKEIPLALSLPEEEEFLDDFRNGVENLKSFNHRKHIVQFVGYCNVRHALFTEYHPLGSAADFFKHTVRKNLVVSQSLEFCLQYAEILSILHNSADTGPRVFCDSNSLDKILGQLLVTTQLTLILNDVDALPTVVDSSGIVCGHRQLVGTFVAPEQLWTGEGEFREDAMPGYDEKTDIWKAASVCEFFLGQAISGEPARYRLFDLHSRCKNKEPKLRPSADELVHEYTLVVKEYSNHSEL